ncbi:MAG: hypothetical protein FWE54_01655 [Methanimicrococcus sp.]|nr:hypothetical protein [Methanimicrococcus sp.]
MDTKIILSALGLLFCVTVFLPFGIAMLAGSTEQLNGTVPADALPAYNATTGAIVTAIDLTQYLPWIAGMIVVISILMFLGSIAFIFKIR